MHGMKTTRRSGSTTWAAHAARPKAAPGPTYPAGPSTRDRVMRLKAIDCTYEWAWAGGAIAFTELRSMGPTLTRTTAA